MEINAYKDFCSCLHSDINGRISHNAIVLKNAFAPTNTLDDSLVIWYSVRVVSL